MTAASTHRWTASDGVELAWHELGEGRPVILLHGLFSDANMNWIKFGHAERIAANGFRFRVPYGTLLCVSDKPLHGELKLPGMASDFYRTQVNRHLQIGLRAMEILRDQPAERLHSRKLRSFAETAFQ